MEDMAALWLSAEDVQDLMTDEPELQDKWKAWAKQLRVNNSDLTEEMREWLDTERYDAKLPENLGVIPTKVNQKKFWTVIEITNHRGQYDRAFWIDDFRDEEANRDGDRWNENPTKNIENAEKMKDDQVFRCLVPNKYGKKVPCTDIMELPSYGEPDRRVITDIEDYLVDSQLSEISYQRYQKEKERKQEEKDQEALERKLKRKQKLEKQKLKTLKKEAKRAFKKGKGQKIVKILAAKEGERRDANTALFSL